MTIKSQVPVTVVGGSLKPDVPLDLPEGTKVVVDIHSPAATSDRVQAAEEFLRYCRSISFDSGDDRFRREDVYDRA
jgi:predicted DNA-binding antitoxin AbrB/MazE fold protein